MATESGPPAEDEQLVVGRYRLCRRIGAGAMGVVWEGRDERLNRPVAIKKLLLHPSLAPRKAAEAVARCLREGRIAARLHHPNAITVFDVVDEDEVPCLVMEYVPSRSLATVLAEDGELSPEKAADVGAQVAAALAAAHAAGITHRDITPGNILIGEDGSVKLTDFGISRAADDVTVTKSGMVAGTPAYLAPEVALGAEPTPASDVFSLGSTLYTAVEGEPPFGRAANTLGLLHAVAGGKINPPQRSGPLTDVLVALLAADPANRPTAAEARDLLAGVGGGEVPLLPVPLAAAAAEEPAGAETTQLIDAPTPVRRAHRPMAAAAGVLVVALLALGFWLMGGQDGLRPADERGPSNGTGSGGSAPGMTSEQVAPVRAGQHTDAPRTPVPTAGAPATAVTSTEATAPPATTGTTAPPPSTTTENAQEPTTGGETTTEAPASGGETVTEPPATTAAGVE